MSSNFKSDWHCEIALRSSLFFQTLAGYPARVPVLFAMIGGEGVDVYGKYRLMVAIANFYRGKSKVGLSMGIHTYCQAISANHHSDIGGGDMNVDVVQRQVVG